MKHLHVTNVNVIPAPYGGEIKFYVTYDGEDGEESLYLLLTPKLTKELSEQLNLIVDD